MIGQQQSSRMICRRSIFGYRPALKADRRRGQWRLRWRRPRADAVDRYSRRARARFGLTRPFRPPRRVKFSGPWSTTSGSHQTPPWREMDSNLSSLSGIGAARVGPMTGNYVARSGRFSQSGTERVRIRLPPAASQRTFGPFETNGQPVGENQHGRVVHRGTKGSNPLSSSGESANFRFRARCLVAGAASRCSRLCSRR